VVLLHDGREVVIRHAILSFTDGIYEIIKRYVGTDEWQVSYGRLRSQEREQKSEIRGREIRDHLGF
jgi:hypothetical protein